MWRLSRAFELGEGPEWVAAAPAGIPDVDDARKACFLLPLVARSSHISRVDIGSESLAGGKCFVEHTDQRVTIVTEGMLLIQLH